MLGREYYRALTRLHDAQAAFENQGALSRLTSETPSASALRHIHRSRDLTRQLIEAEEALAAAKATAIAAGVDLGSSDVSSGFMDRSHDGKAGSNVEIVITRRIDERATLKWLGCVPGEGGKWAKLPSCWPEEADAWECKSVDIADSGSAVAAGSERRWIDKWKTMCADLNTLESGPEVVDLNLG